MTATSSSATLQSATNRGRFVWHELATTDVESARRFYTQVIGWTTQHWDGPIKDYLMWMSGDAVIGGLMPLVPEALAMGAKSAWIAYVEVPDADATVAHATALGGAQVGEAITLEQVGRLIMLRDPRGAMLAVMTSATQPPSETDPGPYEFSWHELVTTDPAAAIEFYNKLFGWESKGEFELGENKGPYKMFGRDRFTYGGVMRMPPGMNMPSHWLPYINVADSVPAAIERARQAGGTSMLGPMDVPNGGEVAILRDREGAMFAIHGQKKNA